MDLYFIERCDIIDDFILTYPYFIIMSEWCYVKDIKSDKADIFCEKSMKKYPNRIYKIGTARSNNPGMTAVYYREK